MSNVSCFAKTCPDIEIKSTDSSDLTYPRPVDAVSTTEKGQPQGHTGIFNTQHHHTERDPIFSMVSTNRCCVIVLSKT